MFDLDLFRVARSMPHPSPGQRFAQLMTPWGERLDPDRLAESTPHPRPQLRRDRWQSLDGWWDYAFVKTDGQAEAASAWLTAAIPDAWDGRIVVPFSPEALLSQVNRQLQPDELLWYHRRITTALGTGGAGTCGLSADAPGADTPDHHVILHLDGVDWACAVWVDGTKATEHTGAYLPFTVDLTDALRAGNDTCDLALCVYDPSSAGTQLRGKQRLDRGTMWYTAQSGIWQPVWLEEVPAAHIVTATLEADPDTGRLRVHAQTRGRGTLTVRLCEGQARPSAPTASEVSAAQEAPALSETPAAQEKTREDKRANSSSVFKPCGAPLATGRADAVNGTVDVTLPVANPHLWSPDDPYLYDVELRFDASIGEQDGTGVAARPGSGVGAQLGSDVSALLGGADASTQPSSDADADMARDADVVHSYCAFRTCEVVPDAQGTPRFCLNHRPLLLEGVLDQGYWSDGLLTPPADEAYVADIQAVRDLGFNLLRLHIKVEQERFYYHCDRLGMLVWQDMPSGGAVPEPNRSLSFPTVFELRQRHFRDDTPRHRRELGSDDLAYQAEWRTTCHDTIVRLGNHPCIVAWGLFNESWGQFDAARACRDVRALDLTRPVSATSGWYDQGVGDFLDVHNYFRRLHVYGRDGRRAFVVSECGGLTYHLPEHSVLPEGYGYEMHDSAESYAAAVQALRDRLRRLWDKGLAGYVYTQLNDVEEETNGILTYDRRVDKLSGSRRTQPVRPLPAATSRR